VTGKLYLWIVFFVLLGLSSCKTARVIPASADIIKPMSTTKLIRNIENNAFDYKHLSVKKINCQFDNGKSKTSFRASIQAEKDKQIIVMLTKLNIPVGRLWLTPDSVKFINYLENNYLLDDYSQLSSMFGMDLSFQTVNAIISNDFFSLRDEKRDKDNRDYESSTESGMYLLQSVKNLKSVPADQKRKTKKTTAGNGKLLTSGPVRQSLYVDPVSFKLRKIKMEDAANARSVNVEFSGFTEVGKQLYPADIFLHILSPENNIQLQINMSNFSMKEEKGVRFKVPEKFTQIGHE